MAGMLNQVYGRITGHLSLTGNICPGAVFTREVTVCSSSMRWFDRQLCMNFVGSALSFYDRHLSWRCLLSFQRCIMLLLIWLSDFWGWFLGVHLLGSMLQWHLFSQPLFWWRLSVWLILAIRFISNKLGQAFLRLVQTSLNLFCLILEPHCLKFYT